ncbi:hypothetical protein MKZ38_004056 [Zalerion maritima]|uniref:Uncharacterized protein n=1 Tax=Zalerion maritima TaxID=339359 RepID=A0AAD5WQ63_9PEZI|nr:hypothetical protein MKZ38_004056 [Zalerion maritima]
MMATSATTENTTTAAADQVSATIVDAASVAPTSLSIFLTLVQQTVTAASSSNQNADAYSVSGSAPASDNETPRADSFKKDGNKGHARAGSTVKKPTSFKAVSVNKTFLASKAAGNGTSTPKLGEKPSPTTSSSVNTANTISAAPSSRPRLVAKAGSGSAFRAGGKPAAAPDPNAVWNKNRPPPVQDTKAMTDEELRKNLGIHMATRLHTDEGKGNVNNWADEDDDDEWVPDTISWADGTKTTIPHPDEGPAPHPDPTPVAAATAVSMASPSAAPVAATTSNAKTQSPVPSHTAPPTIKPGLPSGKGLILKGGQEKPTLVAKPAGPPAPVKSPWATLPPIKKASPVEPPPDHGNRFSKDNRPFHHAFKEIAADDFSRSSWRDGPHGSSSRELYNSHSGRYEPANDRRSFQRNDSRPRHPAVLQRPPAGMHENEGPAEPSSAFQTSRTSSHDGPYSRRRGSSNVSGGSGLLHRLGKDHAPPIQSNDHVMGRRESFATGSDTLDSPRNFSPRIHSSQPWQPSPRMPHASPYQQPAALDSRTVAPEPARGQANPGESEYDFQRRVMREKRELAMKRRLEQEAKEEAEKQERIRLKLEALGPAPERKSIKKEKEKEAAAVAAVAATNDTAAGEGVSALVGESPPADIQQNEGAVSAPQEPIPDISSATHETTNSSAAIPGTKTSNLAAAPAMNIAFKTAPEPNVRGDAAGAAYGISSSRLIPHDDNRQSWAPKVPPTSDRFSSWGPIPTSRIWGAPHSDRSLGNGTFSSDLGRPLDSHPASGHANSLGAGPGPIAPPSSTRSQVSVGSTELSYAPRPAPIAPPSRQVHSQPAPPTEPARKTGLDPWRTPNFIQLQDQALADESKRRHEAEMRELEARGMTLEQAQASIQDTWKAVDLRNDGSRSEVRKVESVMVNSTENSAAPGAPFDATLGTRSAADNSPSSLPTATHPPATRGSRFFPARDRDARPSDHTAHPISGFQNMRTKSPSPPPPTMAGHPAYDGDIKHPHVSFPPKKPVVKLPPAASPTSLHGQRNSLHPSRQNLAPKSPDHTMQENWQDKINSLLTGRKSTAAPPPARSIVVDSASKHALDHTGGLPSPANVVLPSAPSVTVALTDDESSYTTKPMDEDCFEEQEMGSLPPIRIPRKAPDVALLPIPMAHFRTPRSYRLFTSTSKEEFPFGWEGFCRIFLPGMDQPRRVDNPRFAQAAAEAAVSATPATPSRLTRGRGGGRGSSGSGRRGGPYKPRESSGASYLDSQRTSSHRSRGGGRYNSKSSDTWSRRTSTTQAS